MGKNKQNHFYPESPSLPKDRKETGFRAAQLGGAIGLRFGGPYGLLAGTIVGFAAGILIDEVLDD
ncbi:hypothetical protein [Vibrio sp. SCSIO 43137]|uniref:hypothetical protein n=1 Tax=Vibrio sp. SCSIO 43137 TaxID=3021011 RepID=UPI00230751F7|nr:hypothetical protein [Vibrio sp. SCSIO 43137]WCE32079.1 hypothetical protein PK654_16360 [Vibrio sp. SCSIO 43137]